MPSSSGESRLGSAVGSKPIAGRSTNSVGGSRLFAAVKTGAGASGSGVVSFDLSFFGDRALKTEKAFFSGVFGRCMEEELETALLDGARETTDGCEDWADDTEVIVLVLDRDPDGILGTG